MQPKVFQDLLRELGELAVVVSDPGARSILAGLPDLFEGARGKDVGSFLEKIRRKPGEAMQRNFGQRGAAQKLLGTLASVFLLAGGKSAASDVEKLCAFLGDWGDAPIAQIIADAKASIAPAAMIQRSGGMTREPKPPKEIQASVVQQYASDLRQTSAINTSFDEVMERIKKDKRVRLEELREIVGLYLGEPPRRTAKKTDLLKRIIDAQALDARQRARAGLTP
jgi:hypothetical protein